MAGALALLLAAGSAGAQESAGLLDALTRAGISWSLRTSYWSSDRELNSRDHFGAAALWIKAEGRPLPGVSYFTEAWGAARGSEGVRRDDAELREAYAEVRAGRFDARIGRQIIVWGRADGINPTDRLSSVDYRFLVPEDDDRRMGMGAARATYYAGGVALTALWLPEFRANRVGLPPSVAGAQEDRERWNRDAWAVRVEQTGRSIDWSVSYGSTLDASPDLAAQSNPGGPATIELAHHRIRFVGGDVAGTAGRFGVRAEAAYLHTADPDGLDPSIKNREVFAVGGVDRTFGGTLNVNAQYVYRHVLDFDASDEGASREADPIGWQQGVLSGQSARVQHGASGRVAVKLLHETLEVDVSGLAYFGPRGGVIRPKVAYLVNDHLKLTAGSEHYGGSDRSMLGLLRPNSTAFLELRLSF
jgi:hypothetical protein